MLGGAALLLTGLGGCVASPPVVVDTAIPQAGPTTATHGASFAAEPGATPLRPRDRINVRVLREPELSLDEVRVGEDGNLGWIPR